MTPYLMFFFAIIGCAQLSAYRKNGFFVVVVAFILSALFAGLRFQTGWDYEAYQYFYDSLSNSSLFEIFNENGPVQAMGFEPGFAILIWICSALGTNYQLVLAIATVGLCFYSVYRLDRNALPFYIVIHLWYGYFHNFSIVRQGISGALVFFAIVIADKQKRLSMCSYLVSSLLHYSALVLSPIIWLLIRFSTMRILLVSLVIGWTFSFLEIFRGILFPIISLVAPERWLSLITIEEITGKVGVSLILLEYSFASLILYTNKLENRAISFARGVLVYKILTYGLFNDVSIIWERTSSFADAMYAASLAIILAGFIKAHVTKRKLIQASYFFMILFLSLYVFVKYQRMLGSEVRIEGERSHYERFIPYRSILSE